MEAAPAPAAPTELKTKEDVDAFIRKTTGELLDQFGEMEIKAGHEPAVVFAYLENHKAAIRVGLERGEPLVHTLIEVICTLTDILLESKRRINSFGKLMKQQQ